MSKYHFQKIVHVCTKNIRLLFQIFSNVFQNNSQENFYSQWTCKITQKKKKEILECFVYKYITWTLIYDSNLWPLGRVMHLLEAYIQQSPLVQHLDLFKSFFSAFFPPRYYVSCGIFSWNASIVLVEKLGASGQRGRRRRRS